MDNTSLKIENNCENWIKSRGDDGRKMDTEHGWEREAPVVDLIK